MNLRTLFFTSTIAAMATGGAAFAVDEAVIADITNEMVAQGYTRLHIRHGPTWADVEAYGTNGKVERRYDGAGEMLRERLYAGEEAEGDDAPPLGEQTRSQTRAGGGSCDDACDRNPVQARAQSRDQLRDGAGGGDGDRAQTRAVKGGD